MRNQLLPLLVLLAPLSAQAKAPPMVVVQEKDGTRFRGLLLDATVKLETGYGHAVVRRAAIGAITFGPPTTILTTDEHEISGTLAARSLRFRVGTKNRAVPVARLTSVSRLVDGAGFAESSFRGKWSTNYGPLALSLQGAKATGTWGYQETKVQGTVEDGQLHLQGDDWSATLRLAERGRLLLGEYAGSQRTSFWGGYRIRPRVAPHSPGVIVEGQTKSWLNYHLRLPKSYDKNQRYPAIALLHGSNMSARAYVNTFARAWPVLAKRYILVGFDGQNLSPNAKPDRRAYNYSYVNFSGPEVGNKGVHRQSPALVAEALDELRGQLPIDHWFLGGHSQGGFLTYAVYMFYPDKVKGVFPMSCNLLVQCEPDFGYFKKATPEFRARQREVAIAVIHGENDQVVPFSGGESCYASMVDGGFPMLRFFRHPTAAHMFARLPVDAAILWLEQLTSDDPTTLIAFAEVSAQERRYRDAAAAVLRLRAVGIPGDLQRNVAAVARRIDEAAAQKGGELAGTIRANRDNSWVDGFLEFREAFAFADGAKPVMAAYADLRSVHAAPADELFWAARRLREADERNAKYREIVEKYYASKWYRLVKGWLDD